MSAHTTKRILVVGWGHEALGQIWERIDKKSSLEFRFVMHPKFTRTAWIRDHGDSNHHFFFDSETVSFPAPDRDLLASLERDGVPTVHNMIKGDRVVSRLSYADALSYATYLAKRLESIFEEVSPLAIVGGFDAVHSGMALAVAKRMDIPWYTMNFSVIPSGLVCLCDEMHPAARVILQPPDDKMLRARAEEALAAFEGKRLTAPLYVEPGSPRTAERLKQIPAHLAAGYRTARKSKNRNFLRFVEYSSGHSITAAMRLRRQRDAGRRALSQANMRAGVPVSTPFAFFGFHMQPESSIDVWAPFYSDQFWVVELIARSLPPTHKLLVKVHKSDISRFSYADIERLKNLPGVEIVNPESNARKFIEASDLVFAIQGTIGLEAALLGKPVIMFGDSPVIVFPSAARIGRIHDLPDLIGRMLTQKAPAQEEILRAYTEYLAPFHPACHNNWSKRPSDEEIEGFVQLYDRLDSYLSGEGRG